MCIMQKVYICSRLFMFSIMKKFYYFIIMKYTEGICYSAKEH